MPPTSSTTTSAGIQTRLKPGMVLRSRADAHTRRYRLATDDDEWTVRTVDGHDAAHWEHSIATTMDRVSVLTARDGEWQAWHPTVTPVAD